jgi:hypothetical protein
MSSSPESRVLEVERWLECVVADLEVDRRTGPGAPRVLPALLLWTGLVVCVLRGLTTQLGLWRLLAQHGLWSHARIHITDDAVYKRLARAGSAPMEQLFAQVTALLAARIEPWVDLGLGTFAADVVAIDETTLDKVGRLLPTLRDLPPRHPDRLAGTLAGVFDLRRQQWRRVLYRQDTLQNERVAARDLVSGLLPGTLILADLGYFGFKWFDDLTDDGFFWLSRLRSKTSHQRIHTLYEQGDTLDALIWLGAYRSDHAKHVVRLIQFSVNGHLYRYITNVLDPAQLGMLEAARLYARRWDIELAIKTVKTHLGLQHFWSATPVGIQQQVWAVLIIAQIFSSFRMEIAARAEVDLFAVSLPLLIAYFPHYAHAGTDPIELFIEHGRQLGFIRPSSRTRIDAPVIPRSAYHPPPPDLVLVREPRYAERNCQKKAS